MKYVVGFTQSPGQRPFHLYESEASPPSFAIGSKILAGPQATPQWLQITAIAYQVYEDAIVTTVVVSEATSIGGDGEEFLPWPW